MVTQRFFCVSQVLLRSNLETADFRKETFCEILKTKNIEKKVFSKKLKKLELLCRNKTLAKRILDVLERKYFR